MLEAIYYTNEQGQTIRFAQYRSSDTDLRVDTEGATVQNISIHNNDALLAEKQGLVSSVWKEEFLFSLIGEVDKAEMIKMAESISKNKWKFSPKKCNKKSPSFVYLYEGINGERCVL